LDALDVPTSATDLGSLLETSATSEAPPDSRIEGDVWWVEEEPSSEEVSVEEQEEDMEK